MNEQLLALLAFVAVIGWNAFSFVGSAVIVGFGLGVWECVANDNGTLER